MDAGLMHGVPGRLGNTGGDASIQRSFNPFRPITALAVRAGPCPLQAAQTCWSGMKVCLETSAVSRTPVRPLSSRRLPAARSRWPMGIDMRALHPCHRRTRVMGRKLMDSRSVPAPRVEGSLAGEGREDAWCLPTVATPGRGRERRPRALAVSCGSQRSLPPSVQSPQNTDQQHGCVAGIPRCICGSPPCSLPPPDRARGGALQSV